MGLGQCPNYCDYWSTNHILHHDPVGQGSVWPADKSPPFQPRGGRSSTPKEQDVEAPISCGCPQQLFWSRYLHWRVIKEIPLSRPSTYMLPCLLSVAGTWEECSRNSTVKQEDGWWWLLQQQDGAVGLAVEGPQHRAVNPVIPSAFPLPYDVVK